MEPALLGALRQERIMRAAVRKVGAGIAHAFN